MRPHADRILYLSRSEVEKVCDEIDPVSVVQEIFGLHGASDTVLPDEAFLGWQTPAKEVVRSLNMPSYVGGRFRAAGTKIINSNPANVSRGIPRASGLMLIFDPETARPCCIMDAAYISALRTAAVSIFSIERLADGPVASMAILGAGVIGAAHLRLAARHFPELQNVFLFDTNRPAAEELARTFVETASKNVQLHLTSNAETAVRATQVIIPTTTATTGYISYEWLNPGAIVINVSLDDLLPDVFLKADLLFVDDWNLVRGDSRRRLGRMYREGSIVGPDEKIVPSGSRQIDAELGDLVLGRHLGRSSPEEIVVVNPFGLSIEDVGIASQVFDIASSLGLGISLPV
jgi:N-[(2S)-2-amino-2-carboxyethyl]-L-glutamate dehydrogenase